jgi:hypothetical protein
LLAQFPAANSFSLGKITAVTFTYSGQQSGKNNTEVPPWVLDGQQRNYFFVNGTNTYIWSSPASLTSGETFDLDKTDGPHEASRTFIQSISATATAAAVRTSQDWKRNYHGIYSASSFTHPVLGPITLGFLHGENKNVLMPDGTRYQNTIQPNVTINPSDPGTYSGGSPYHEGWEAYNGIISASWIPNNAQTNWGAAFFQNEMGPIAWPATGYVTRNGVKSTSGLRHPSSLVDGGYVYVFYLEGGAFGSNVPDEEGRKEGIKVIRAPLDSALDPASYRVYYQDSSGTDTWKPSLPDGLTPQNMLKFVSVRGPKATDLMQDSLNHFQEIRFSVAKLRNLDYYVGVEQYMDLEDSSRIKLALHFSTDLVHWTGRVLIIYTAPDWNRSRLNYPIFLNKEGNSNSEVDLDDFFILGASSSPLPSVNRLEIKQGLMPAAFISTLAVQPTSFSDKESLVPNPTMGLTQFNYTLSFSAAVDISLFDMNGRKLASLDHGIKEAGRHTQTIDLGGRSNGVYVVGLYINGAIHSFRLVRQ